MTTDIDSLAVTVIVAMQGRWVATAESITGGQLGATITAIPGASKIYRGGVISYATDLKSSLLGVSDSLLAEGGAVQAQVAGPNSQDGHLPGTVFVACVQRDESGSVVDSVVDELHLYPETDDPRDARDQIREETVAAALELLLTFL